MFKRTLQNSSACLMYGRWNKESISVSVDRILKGENSRLIPANQLSAGLKRIRELRLTAQKYQQHNIYSHAWYVILYLKNICLLTYLLTHLLTHAEDKYKMNVWHKQVKTCMCTYSLCMCIWRIYHVHIWRETNKKWNISFTQHVRTSSYITCDSIRLDGTHRPYWTALGSSSRQLKTLIYIPLFPT
jgi:hypothetical protein